MTCRTQPYEEPTRYICMKYSVLYRTPDAELTDFERKMRDAFKRELEARGAFKDPKYQRVLPRPLHRGAA